MDYSTRYDSIYRSAMCNQMDDIAKMHTQTEDWKGLRLVMDVGEEYKCVSQRSIFGYVLEWEDKIVVYRYGGRVLTWI